MKCPKCGRINPDRVMYCEKCRSHLGWARGKQVQKRRKPFTWLELHVIFVVVGMVGLISLVYFIVTDARSDFLGCAFLLSICVLPVGLCGLLWVLRSPRSSHNVFRRSSTTTQARILDCHIVTSTVSDEDGISTFSANYATFQFDAVRPGRAVEQVTLRAEVSKKLYDRLLTGTKLTVRYASEDPCVALFEGEPGFTWFT